MMKAVVCKTLDGPTALTLDDVETPAVSAGMILVDVQAASLNFPDVLITQGKYQMKPELPFVPGGEGAGLVAAVGEGVSGFNVGDRILFTGSHGAFAETALLPAMMCVKIPDEMDFKSAAALTITYATSYHALKQRANLQAGEIVAVLGAAGGVGLATIELAKAMGARVIACASSDEKLAVCKEAGADDLLNYGETDLKAGLKALAPKGIDVIYDPVGGDYSEAALRAMANNGRHLVIGFAAGDIPSIPLNLTLLKQCQIVGVFWGAWAMKNPKGQYQNMQDLFALFGKGDIAPRVKDSFSLSQYAEAYACLTERRVKGKVVFDLSH